VEKSSYNSKAEIIHLRCPVCSNSCLTTLFVKEEYPVRGCSQCGVRFLSPQPDDARLETIYDAEYFLGARSSDAERYVSRMKRATASLYLTSLDRYLKGARGRILEIGCGQGDFLLEAYARGFEVNGVEISPSAANIANNRLGGERIFTGILEEVDFPEQFFDVVAFADTIEHVRDPMEFLLRVFAIIKPGGMVFVVTPSLDSWSAKLMGSHWMEYKIEHLYYFGKRAMRFALRRAGFEGIVLQPNFKVLDLNYICQHFARFRVPMITPLLNMLEKVAPKSLAHRQIKLVASGLVAIGWKPNGHSSH